RGTDRETCAGVGLGCETFVVLEPCVAKVTRTVLWGGWARNGLSLPAKLVAATLASMMCLRPIEGRKSKLCLDLGHDYDAVHCSSRRVRASHLRPARRAGEQEAMRCTYPALGGRTRAQPARTAGKRVDTYLAMLPPACGLIVWRTVPPR
ncbi:MAG TPA: hypothetical protein VJ654_12005, partial [Noviherbaspirillum sp.]|nr:hypothetical protein [Noviherbaspirillum sp.]